MSGEAAEISRQLIAWLAAEHLGIRVAAGGIGRESAEDGIDLYLLGTAPRQEPRSSGQLRWALGLDYFIAVRTTDAIEEHSILANIAFSALVLPGCETLATPTPAEACRAIGLSPRAGLVLRMEARRDQALPRAPRVRVPIITRLGPLDVVHGLVTGPGDTPIASAVITISEDGRSTTTDKHGRFSLALPSGLPVTANVRAREYKTTARLIQGESPTIPINLEP